MSGPRIYAAGHRGMVGSAIVRTLLAQGVPTANIITLTHAELDLTDQAAVNDFFAAERPEQVYLAPAKVGGVHANNTYPAEFIYQNLMLQANVILAAHTWRAKAVVSGLQLPLPTHGPSAYGRGSIAHRHP
jgi:GDP-L-fucose synthase